MVKSVRPPGSASQHWRREDLLHRKSFQIPQFTDATLIKSNAFEIECPTEALQFDLKVWPTERVWASLREAAGERPLVAVPLSNILDAREPSKISVTPSVTT